MGRVKTRIRILILLLCLTALAIGQMSPFLQMNVGTGAAIAGTYELADTASGTALVNADTTCFARMDSLRAVTIIVVGVHDYPTMQQSAQSVTDNYGNSYTLAVTASNNVRNGRVTMFYCANPTITGDTIRIRYRSVNQISSYPDMAVQAWRGVASPVLDGTSTNYISGGGNTTTGSGTLTPSVATAMGGGMWGGTIVPAANTQPTATGSLTTANQQMWWNYVLNRRLMCAIYYKTNIGTSAFTTTHTHTKFTSKPGTYAIGWAFR